MIGVLAAAQNLTRRALWPAIDAALSRVGLYASYPLKREEYAVTVLCDLSEARRLLWEIGYRPAPVAALKQSPRGEVSRGSWAYRDPPLWRSDRQTHVHLIPAGGVTHLYVHDETNWWPAPSDPMRWRRHYRPPERGASDESEEVLAYDWAEGQRILTTQLDHVGASYKFDPTRIP